MRSELLQKTLLEEIRKIKDEQKELRSILLSLLQWKVELEKKLDWMATIKTVDPNDRQGIQIIEANDR